MTPVVINMSPAPLRLGLANRRVTVPFAHQSDQRNTLSDLRESSLLLRLLRWLLCTGHGSPSRVRLGRDGATGPLATVRRRDDPGNNMRQTLLSPIQWLRISEQTTSAGPADLSGCTVMSESGTAWSGKSVCPSIKVTCRILSLTYVSC